MFHNISPTTQNNFKRILRLGGASEEFVANFDDFVLAAIERDKIPLYKDLDIPSKSNALDYVGVQIYKFHSQMSKFINFIPKCPNL